MVEKVTNNVGKTLTYWDGNGDPPAGGYYTYNKDDRTVSFFGDAVIGKEMGDSSQDYYRFVDVNSNSSK